MVTISIKDAEARFGPLIEMRASSFLEFETPEGLWRPVFEDGSVRNYRLFPKRPVVKKKWTPRHYSRSPRL